MNKLYEHKYCSSFMSGIAGSKAMFINVTTLMWLNTTTNIQYCKGGNMYTTINSVYRKGGIFRFYNGFVPTLLHGCISRFGDIYSHSFVKNNKFLENKHILLDTVFSATLSSTFRSLITPLDTFKIIQQMDGTNDFASVKRKLFKKGPSHIWNGAGAVFLSNFVGYIPWFYTYEFLDHYIPYDPNTYNLFRNATIGFTSSIVSDFFSNGVRVIKTIKQHDTSYSSYTQLVKCHLQHNNATQLMFRGLETRIITNCVQSILFTILWKWFEQQDSKPRLNNK